jgi:hypothetical protein
MILTEAEKAFAEQLLALEPVAKNKICRVCKAIYNDRGLELCWACRRLTISAWSERHWPILWITPKDDRK